MFAMAQNHLPLFAAKMRQAGLGDAAIRAFAHSYARLLANESGMLPEREIEPVTTLPALTDQQPGDAEDKALMSQVALVKLNGGLGTSMGLDSPKSLLPVRQGLTFLDIIARQVLHARQTTGVPLRLLMMNSRSTSTATRAWLAHQPELGSPAEVELMQSFIPKVDATTFQPAQWPANPELEWCPPGHGDLYPSLLGSGWLDRLLKEGVRYLFVSNADNLGATLELRLLQHFARSGASFLMEVCERTAADRKGGHLALRRGRLLLREAAQCPAEDQSAFQDIHRHRFFNTNNLWLRLDRLKEVLNANDGLIPLPVIQNRKTVDPRDSTSPKVIQLETAMGAATECFEDARAIVVPRSRFAPVKTTADLLAVRSDAYELTADHQVQLHASRRGKPPALDLDGAHYKHVDQMDAALADGVPSLRACDVLKVAGPVRFERGVQFTGTVTVTNASTKPAMLPAGQYRDATVTL
jgi:UDP-N-acetylglucosamine pyrophosphorylase